MVSNTKNDTLWKDLKQYYKDIYNNDVKIYCDDTCKKDCNKDHVTYELPTIYKSIYKEI